MKVLISGAGIGGLTTALCLQKAGYEVTVFEQAQGFFEVGAGLQCGANALAVFDWLGLLPQLERLAGYQQKYGYPYLHLHRVDLHQVLLDAFQGKIFCNSQVVSYQETQSEVQVQLNDGRTFNGDLLIGADGIKSPIRQQLLSGYSPRFTSHAAWRGVVPRSELPEDFMEKIASNFMGQGKHMVIYYLRDQQLVNFVGVVPCKAKSDESWVSQGSWDELKEDFQGWHPTVLSVINAMEHKPCFRWDLYDHKPLKNWSSKRVTLLGDAAHATLPFMASGAAMAIEDARILQRSLALSGEFPPGVEGANMIAKALQLYQHNRISRTSKIQKDSAKFGHLYHLQNPIALNLAFKVLNSIAKRKEDFLPSYDANSVELI